MTITAALVWTLATLLPACAVAQGIYTCVDSKGRKITSDRQITECTDRTQHELSPSGTVRRVLGPALTERELAAQEEKDKQLAATRLREQEDKRRSRAMVLRYPSRPSHDKERGLALAQIDELLSASQLRAKELATQNASINAEFEFYKKDPSKAPAALVRRRDENDRNIAEQKRFVVAQNQEKQRVNARFDEELAKLQQLWAMSNPPATDTPASSPQVTVKK